MNQSSPNGDGSSAHHSLTSASPPGGQDSWLARNPWAPLVVPFAIYMLCGMFEPTPDKPFQMLGLTIEYAQYPLVYLVKILLTLAAVAAFWPAYRQYPFRLTGLAPVVGVVGAVLWVVICKLEIEANVLGPLGLDSVIDLGRRVGFNPLEEYADRPALAYGFLALRFIGLALVVPFIEEFFLRAFVMRFVIDADWWKVPFGTITPLAVAAGTIIPVLSHPAELLAAAVWFTLVTWLMFKTKSIWDCIVAHAVTNGLLGVWVVASGDWYFL